MLEEAKHWLWICLFLGLLASGTSRYRYERPSRVVEIKQGRLQGTLVEVPLVSPYSSAGADKNQVEIYKGIPFAAPPIGSLRFMPPVTVTPWREIRSATHFGPVCPQMMPDTRNQTAALSIMSEGRFKAIRDMKPSLANQTEDCLYLNVYSPLTSASSSSSGSYSSEKKELNPVIVFIHGDNYEWGSGNLYDGSVLAALGKVVVVTLNYRLGILGFLNANTDGKSRHPSNLGILDQIAALHWVQENIANFGGDPRNVTLMGHGTGAACVHFLMTSEALPEGKLFHRVILMSGSALAPWAVVSDPARATLQVASALNCTEEQLQNQRNNQRGRSGGGSKSNNNLAGSGDQSLLGCLRSVPLYQLMRAARPHQYYAKQEDLLSPSAQPISSTWGPSFDGVVVHSFRRRMRDYLDRMARYELLFGVTTADAVFSLNNRQLEYGLEPEERNRIISQFVSANYGLHQREIFAAIVNEYTDWQSAAQHPVNIRDQTLEALTDAHYVAPLLETGDYHSSLNARSWFYVFDYQTKNSYYKQRGGCVHGEELNYVLGYPLLRPQDHSSDSSLPSSSTLGDTFLRNEANLAYNIIQFWSNFAATGNPNLSRKSDGKPYQEEWESYDPKHKKYIAIGLKPRMKDHYRPQKMALWMNLIPDLQSAAIANQARSRGGDIVTASEAVQGANVGQVDGEAMLDYRLYNELLPFVPKLKNLDTNALNRGSTPASSEVLDLLGRGNTTPHEQAMSADGGLKQRQGNSSYIVQQDSTGLEGLSSYSTALSVTIAIGCSLLVLNVLIFTAVYYQRDRNRDRNGSKLDTSILTCNSLSDAAVVAASGAGHLHSSRNRSLDGGMTSISQYIERRPSDCLLQPLGSPPPSRRSLQDMSLPPAPAPPPHPSLSSTTVSVVPAAPRKSALKSSSMKLETTNTFRTHLPPPEFADQSPTTGGGNRHLTMAESHLPQHSSFRTLPRQPTVPPSILTSASSPAVPPHQPQNSHASQTLPLKSNLKKSSASSSVTVVAAGNATINNSGSKLQWSATTTDRPPSALNRVSLEELRV